MTQRKARTYLVAGTLILMGLAAADLLFGGIR